VGNQGNQSAQGSVTIASDEKSGQLPSPDQPSVGVRRGAGGEGGLQSAAAQFSIVKDGRWQHVFTLDLPSSARLTAKIEPGDFYVFDDAAVLDVPAAPAAHRVILSGAERSGLKEILAANRQVPWKDDVIAPSPALGQEEIGPMGLIGPICPLLARGQGEPGGTDIRVPNDVGSDASALVLEPPVPPLWLVPAGLAAVLVIIEWCLYQRRWTT
jgi:hypothetical protein